MQSKFAQKFLGAFAVAALMVTTAQAAAPTAPQGVITAKEFLGITGTAVANLTNHAKFPNSPDVTGYPTLFEWPTVNDPATPPPGNVKNDYGVQIHGYFYPDRTGAHTFWLSADDGAGLWLSTDDDPANKVKIANEPTWNGVRAWTATTRRAIVDQDTGRTENVSAPINLVAGRAYYIEALMKEGGGGDNLSVAVTSDFFEQPWEPILGTQLATIDKASGGVTFTTQPQSQTVLQNTPLTLFVEVNGLPPYEYQWLRNGEEIPDAIGASYSIDKVPTTDNGARYSVRVSNASGPQTSAEAVITVTSDTVAPTLSSTSPWGSLNEVRLVFSEALDADAAVATGNYTIAGLTVTGATLLGEDTVVLSTSAQTAGTAYTVAVSGVKDLAGNNIAATTGTFSGIQEQRGFVLHRFWQGKGLADIRDASAITDPPTRVEYLPRMEFPRNGVGEGGANYANELSGWLTAPESGDYIFFLSADDGAELYLSTDASVSNLKLIAREPEWNNPRQWLILDRRPGSENRSDMFLETEWPNFNTITLTAGSKYAFRIVHAEGGGGDNVGMTWRLPSQTADPANGTPALSGAFVSAPADINASTVTISSISGNGSVVEGTRTNLTVAYTSSSPDAFVQWQRAAAGGQFTDIPGANALSVDTGDLALNQSGTRFRALIVAPGLSQPSDEVVITVVPDTFPPVVLSGGALKKGNAWEITLLVDEKLGNANLATEASVSIPGVTVTGATYVTNVSGLPSPQSGVVLSTSTALTPGQSYAVTYNGLKDRKNNTQTTAATVNITASAMSWADIGTPNDWSDPAVISVSTNGFNLVSGGQSFWGSDDDITLVYEEITGDFDKVARVVYQDPSSQWARAGLTAREALNAGDYPPEEAARYQNAHANPYLFYTGAVSNNGYESNRRGTTGGATTSGGGAANSTTYPNTWVRLKREGSVISSWRSSDGANWIQFNSTDFSTFEQATPLEAKMYVGLVYGPEAGNVPEDSGLRASWAAVIRDYGNFQAPVANGPITVTLAGANITLSWTGTGTLEASDSLSAPNWAPVAGVTGTSHTTAASAARRFYRIRR